MAKVFAKPLLLYANKVVRSLIRPFVHEPLAGQRKAADSSSIRWLSTSDELPPAPDTTADGDGGATTVCVCKVEGGLLMSPSTFQYFMLAALEAGPGGLLRGLLLLLLYPALRLLGHDRAIRVMAAVSFAGVRKDGLRLGGAVMPKLLLEDVSAEVFEAAAAGPGRRRRRCVCVSAMPREMVEPFLKDYLGVDAVVAPELRSFGGYFLGLMESDAEVLRRLNMEEVIGGGGGDGGGGGLVVVGIGGLGRSFNQLFQKYCKEVYVATKGARRRWRPLHPRGYAKPLVFHDARTAFRPTASATLAMFMWLPLGAPLAALRTAVFLLLPFSLSVPLLSALGMHSRRIIGKYPPSSAHNLFVSNHRSLVDPLYVSAATGRADLAAATYSISRLSEILAPMRTFRLTRDRATDRTAMQAHLSSRSGGGGLVVCPEGTTCREPFLLRFSPLFTELGADVQPVAMHSAVSMFHGTTAGGRKVLDPLYLLMNPTPAYVVQLLDPVAVESGGGPELANEVQRRIAEALGYTCTALTRRDKYLALTGDDGVDRCRRRHQQ
uniref:Phospholipid/glycerol acyltransferase domain-containing protein n=2 Tax=Oryza brachyantha TaxID=4533 RepID=J3KZE7_ORYBR